MNKIKGIVPDHFCPFCQNFMSKNPSRRAGRGKPFHTPEALAYRARILAEEGKNR